MLCLRLYKTSLSSLCTDTDYVYINTKSSVCKFNNEKGYFAS